MRPASSPTILQIRVSRVAHRLRLARDRYGLAQGRHAAPFATHLPVLIGIAGLIHPSRVLELGSGDFSTAAFLDRAAFPSLVALTSYETDRGWGERVRVQFQGDGRLQLHVVDRPMAEAIKDVDFEPFDLIFIDDSTTAELRSATIDVVARRCRPDTGVLIHDFDVQPYREAALAFRYRAVFDALNPPTGLCSHRRVLARSQIRSLNRRIGVLAPENSPTELGAWVTLLGGDDQSR